MTEKKLQRSRTNRMLGGVCGGLGHYFNIDPTVVRLIFVLALFFGGSGVFAYLILWVIIPEEPTAPRGPSDYQPPPSP